MTFDDLLRGPQYSLPQPEKEGALLAELNRLGRHHREHCADYVLSSVPENEVFRILQSSGTTGQVPSRIMLDR